MLEKRGIANMAVLIDLGDSGEEGRLLPIVLLECCRVKWGRRTCDLFLGFEGGKNGFGDNRDKRAKVIENQVKAAPIISILSDTFEESVGSHAPRVILFGVILAIIPIIPEVPFVPADLIVTLEVGTVSVISLAGVLDLVDYSSSSDSDLSEDSLPPAPDLPLVSPFLCSDDTEADEFSLAPVVAPPGILRRSTTLVRPGEAIPFGRPYRMVTDLFIDHLLGLHDIVRLLDVKDSSSPSSRPSRKRCRSSNASVPSPTHVSSGEEHMEVDTADAEAIADVGISEGVVAHLEDGVGMGFEIATSDVREDDEEGGITDLEDTIYDIVHYMSEVHIDRITKIKTTQRQLDTCQMVAIGERASLVERIGSLRLEYLKVRAMLSIERDQIDSIRWHMALSQEEFCQVHRDRDDTRRRLRRLESYNGSDGDNGNGGNRDGENGNGENGNGNPNENGRGDRPVARDAHIRTS
ncbi:hypothetical protein Tco_1264594 [Tanacetum coccineum]